MAVNRQDIVALKPCSHCDGDGVEWDHMDIGARMQQIRKDAGLRLRDVAGLMRLSVGYISDLEHGRKNWSERLINFYIAAVETGKENL